MKPHIKYFLWLLASLGILVLLLLLEVAILHNTTQQTKNSYEQTQSIFHSKEVRGQQLISGFIRDTNNLQHNWVDYIELSKRENFIIHIFKNDSLIIWTDNSINSKKYLPILTDGFDYISTNNGAYLVSFKSSGTYKVAVFYQIKTNYIYQNQYIQNHFNQELNFLGSALFSPSPIKDFIDLLDLKGHYLCSIQIFGAPKITPFWLKLAILITVLIGIFMFHNFSKWLVSRNFVLGSIVFIVLTQLGRWLFLKYKIPVFVYGLKLFTADIYASSRYNPSLGDFMIAVAIILWYFFLIKKVPAYNPLKKTYLFLQLIFVSWLTITLADAAFDSIKSLVFDSQISFDIKNIYALNEYTFLGLILSIMLLMLVHQMVLRLYTILKKTDLNSYEKLIITGLVFYFLHPYMVIYLYERNIFYPIGSTLLIASFLAYKHWIQNKINRFQQYFILVVLLSVFTSVCIYYWNNIEEEENRVLFAGKLVSQNDVNAEYFLNDIEKKIASERQIKTYFNNPIALKSQLVKKLRQLYFSGYLSKYDISVYDFDSSLNHYQVHNIFTYKQVNYIYQQLGSKTINQNFRFLKNNAYLKGYLAKFIIRHNGRINGYFFIHLQPKLLQDENRFDELLIEGFRSKSRKRYDYSYAIYRDFKLLSQSGEFAYRTTYTWSDIPDKVLIFEENGYSHLIFKENEQLFVVVSKKAASWYEPFGLFSLAFTFFTFLLIVSLGIYILFNNAWLNHSFLERNKIWLFMRHLINEVLIIKDADLTLIRTRIQLGVVLIVFATLSVTAYFTIDFISTQNAEKQSEKLIKKLRNVVSVVENESQDGSFSTRQNDAEAYINQIADFYNTDITFYNPRGELITSTVKKVYDDGIIAPLMNAEAYFHLSGLRESQYIQTEQIATFNYNGAYVPVFNKNRSLMGYIQLPNFYQQSDLFSEISSIIVGFINLYAFMFLIIGIVAWLVSRNISYPLMLIQQQMAQTTIGKKNEAILWNRNDEIGQLVKQYNLMIDQLEESAEKLGRSEREGAWRDIARQIAHEIKNPLTPMKLSVQHLERAWKDQSPKLPETFKRVTQTLITQIDTLSELATEFSSFAKMPLPKYEHINLHNMIDQVIHLQKETYTGKITFSCDENLLIWFDPSYLNRTLTNLLKNAVQAIPDDIEGEISVMVEIMFDQVVISISDNGSGIAEEQKSKIFMPYFSTKVIGMGLGLPIVKSMVESGGGEISFSSTVGMGTTFTIKLPLNNFE